MPFKFRIDTAAARAPPNKPSSATTTTSSAEGPGLPAGHTGGAFLIGSKHNGTDVGSRATIPMNARTSTPIKIAVMTTMLRKLRSRVCCRSMAV